jgi:hypothetical protein
MRSLSGGKVGTSNALLIESPNPLHSMQRTSCATSVLGDGKVKRFAWATDIHLKFLDDDERRSFLESLAAKDVDGFLINGDIGEGHTVMKYLEEIAHVLHWPVYFVLGNHGFYRGSIRPMRELVTEFAEKQSSWCI